MSQVMITIVAPLDPGRIAEAEAAIDRMGNPAADELRSRLDRLDGELGVHFMSLHALPSFTAGRAHLVLEFSADGDAPRALAQIAAAIGQELATVFALARDWSGGDIGAYLTSHVIRTGFGWGQSPGLGHSGAPGATVGRIVREAALAAMASAALAAQSGGMSALARLADVRERLEQDGVDLGPADARAPFEPAPLFITIVRTALAFSTTYLWPLLPVVLAAAALVARIAWVRGASLWRALAEGVLGGAVAALAAAIAVLVAAGAAYLALRRKEETDWISSRSPDRDLLREMTARENVCAQNHMVSVTEIKPGWLRMFTQRLAFFGVATVGALLYRPGYLGPIGTIHFARWVTLPGTRDLVFFSNYGGSWEAYLEDFITLAHNGLTAVWSNTTGFPKTSNLIEDGATDGERFKRYARQSMRPTRFWYSAYPQLTTDMIRANAGIRRGLSGALSEDDAQAWLCYFGSTLRPEDAIVSSEVQSLLFGGLGFLPYAGLTLWKLPPSTVAARSWLRELAPLVGYGDGRKVRDDDRISAVIQLALGASGLAALGLPEEGLRTFPPAFLDGMTDPRRSRILGDVGASAPESWWWGQAPPDAAVVVYAQTESAFAEIRSTLAAVGERHGAELVHEVEMKVFDRADNFEPFGFADGGSQPVIRGTYKGQKNGDPLHLVEPGEFILGYPDNRGNLPPGPTLPAIEDPGNELPVLDDSADFSRAAVNNSRDLGRNGSFLVIRQLEQDGAAFRAYCDGEAERLAHRLGAPYRVTPDFIAAKLVGRWRNGSPLVRAPYSASESPAIIAENSFQLGLEDPQGLRCPFGAHIRRANPRDSLNPGSIDQIAISNRHRILRVGRKYLPGPGRNPGLLFMCLNGDLERQFEFIQQTWLNGPVISLSCPITLSGERDPLSASDGDGGFTIPTRDGPVKLSPLQRFVTVRGGGYFFLPGKRLLTFLTR
jgi:deferrochelatase/peroxidase EfeB